MTRSENPSRVISYCGYSLPRFSYGGEPTPGCYHGGACTTYPQKGDVRDAILQDEIGLKSARNLGIRVAKTLNMLK